MNRRSTAILAGGLLVAASLGGLQIATLNAATSAAHSAKTAALYAALATPSTNEGISDRFQTRAAGESFIAVAAVIHPHGYDTLSMTYENLDGSPVLEGGFVLRQTENGLRVVIREGTLPGEYRVVIEHLAPSEINHPIIFYVTVTDGEGSI